ncbi:MAG: mechanosensitive ion channel domain-containing protein [Steroidobacteraceae bacterium]
MDLDAPLVGNLRGGTVLASAGIIALLVIGDLLLRLLLKHRARVTEQQSLPDASEGPNEGLRRQLMGAALRKLAAPLSLLVWTYGLYEALMPLIAEAGFGERTHRLELAAAWLRGALTLVAAVWFLARLGRLLEKALIQHARTTHRQWDDLVLPVAGRAFRLLLPLLAVMLATPALEISPNLRAILQNATSILLIGVFVLLLLRLVDAGANLILARYPLSIADNRRARGVHTQVVMLRKMATAAIALFGIASMLMVFDAVRQLGTTLLASAGVAGIIIGFAAQKSLATLLAGFQIAMTQPIRVDDVVIVEGEWGRIEEVTLTYVVVAIWDQRRMILPITYFIEKPFQNWTRTTSEILGTVMLYTDYDVPLDAVRAELDRLLKTTELWDRRVGLLQVTDSKSSTLELRVLVSATDSGRAFDLRCYLRENLVRWLQQNHPHSLPQHRAIVRTEPG